MGYPIRELGPNRLADLGVCQLACRSYHRGKLPDRSEVSVNSRLWPLIRPRVLGEDSLVAQGGETAGLPSLADVGVPKRLRKKVVEKAKESCKDDL